mgnify:CR=1 FL=1
MKRPRSLSSATAALAALAAVAAFASDPPSVPSQTTTTPTRAERAPSGPPTRAETDRSAILMRAPKPGPGGFVGDPYPFETCVVDGTKLGADAVTVVLRDAAPLAEGRQLKFCSAACEAKFNAAPLSYLAKLDEEIRKTQAGSYPLDHCIVMIEKKLDADAQSVVYGNRLYRLCCDKCVVNFDKNLDRYVRVYEKLLTTKQRGKYPFSTCVVSGVQLPEKPFDLVIGTRLVRLADEAAAKKFYENPSEYLAKLDEAKKEQAQTKSKDAPRVPSTK